MPQNAFYPQNRDLLVSQKTTQRHFFSTFHPLSPLIFAIAIVVAFVLLHNSRFSLHCYTQLEQREATPTQKSARKWRCDLSRERLQRAFIRANQLQWTAQYATRPKDSSKINQESNQVWTHITVQYSNNFTGFRYLLSCFTNTTVLLCLLSALTLYLISLCF